MMNRAGEREDEGMTRKEGRRLIEYLEKLGLTAEQILNLIKYIWK